MKTWTTWRTTALEWVLFEIALVLAIAVAIVWWTMPKKAKRREDSAPEDGKR